MIIYSVKPGDTLYSIARQFGVTVAELERFIGLPDEKSRRVGRCLSGLSQKPRFAIYTFFY